MPKLTPLPALLCQFFENVESGFSPSRVSGWLDKCLYKTRAVYGSKHNELPDTFWRTMFGDIGATGRFPCTHHDLDDYIDAQRVLEANRRSGSGSTDKSG